MIGLRGHEFPDLALSYNHFPGGSFQQIRKEICDLRSAKDLIASLLCPS